MFNSTNSKVYTHIISLLFFIVFFLSSTTQAEEKTLIVGTKVAPPFSMLDDKGEWHGLSIDLWDKIAKQLDIKYTWQKHDLPSLLKSVSESSLDVAIAAITVTSERETAFDFSHPYFSTGLSIALPIDPNNGWANVIKGIFSFKMLKLILMLLSILAFIGTLTWLMERKKNPDNFSQNPIKGIASGIWLAAVTMTTVGYGDMSPKTLPGKVLTLIWMFSSLLLVSVIIAGVASTLAASKIDPLVKGPEDLARARIGSIENSTSDKYLKERKIHATYYPSILIALEALQKGDIDAVVYDAALLKYYIHKRFNRKLRLYEGLFELQNYGIAFPDKSPLREPVNRVMLKITESPEWQTTIKNYLGE